MKCDNCGTENPKIAKFCLNCGKIIKAYTQHNNRNTEPFIHNGSLTDLLSDIDLLQSFTSVMMEVIDNKTISVAKDENTDTTINSKLQEIEKELNIKKRELDSQLKVLSSDIIIIDISPDENDPYNYTFNITANEAELNRYIEFYKNEEYGSTITTENYLNIENGDDKGFKINWKDSCPVCKSSKLTPKIQKSIFGLTSKKTLECDKCGAIFKKKGHKYKLVKVNDTHNIIWEKYKHKSLEEDEWTRIRNGGVSNEEQRKISLENQEREKRELEALKERDINEFINGIQNGTINLITNDLCPIILKKNENASIVMDNISLHEPRAVRQTRGGYGGTNIRVAKGVSFNIGKIAAKSESHEELRHIDTGKVILTNKRLIFIGPKRSTNIDLKKIVSIEPYQDGIASQRENKQKTEYFIGTDNSTISFTIEGRSTIIPINGIVLKAAIQGNISKL